ncbi:MAG: response regulator [Lachnospiraceae bacterium]|nr:response regulator [Lachnospiraceae bacterium]
MDDQKISESRLAARTKRSIILAAFVIVFFVSIIMLYYNMLNSETKSNIIKSGEINALNSVQRINENINIGIDDIKLTSGTLDKMLLASRSQEDIKEYVIRQSAAVSDILQGSTTGLYAYINDEYIDGLGWVPGDDFIPTERSWYKEAMANSRKVVVVDPYLDAYTGDMIVTMTKQLCDGKSVVAMDISMNQLQSITESLTRTGDSDIEIILDRNYQVITHSDKAEVGKNYLDESGTFGRALVDNLKKATDSYFSFTYNEKEYMVYDMSLVNDWESLSVTDTTSAYASLKLPLIVTMIVAVVAVGVLLAVLINSGRKEALARRLSHENERALAATRAKSAFLSNMSHEIRTPINAILGMNEMVLRESRDTGILEYSESIRTAGHTLLGLVNDILDFSKIEAGKIEIIPVDYDLSSLINDLVNMVQTRADDKGLTLNLDIDENIPKLLNGDDVRIKQIITNILTNAVKFTDKGSVTFSMGYEKMSDGEDYVLLKVSVKDTGIGIREEDKKKIFAEFERVEEGKNRHIEGTGLGMSITRSLLEMMGSTLNVESEYGKGSIFSFSLLQKVVKWEPLEDYQAAYQNHVKERKIYKERFTAPEAEVLVVDDNHMNLMVFRALIKQTLVKVDLVEDGMGCLARTGRKKYDIIFLDHMMPVMDGIETLHEMRADMDNKNLDTPVICLTANAISGSRDKYIAEGFDDYMSKPIDANKLEEMMMEYLPAEKIVLTAEEDETKIRLEAAYLYIRRAAEDMDSDLLEDAFETMDGYDMPDSDKEKWAGLQEAAEQFEYGKILEILNKPSE